MSLKGTMFTTCPRSFKLLCSGYSCCVAGSLSRRRHLRRGLHFCAVLAALLLAVPSTSALARDAYVANIESGTVSVIDTQTNQVVGSPIVLGKGVAAIAITPDGRRAYVANEESGTVSVIDTQTNQVVGAPITVGKIPAGIAITPDGKRAYVANGESDTVSVIDTQSNQALGSPIGLKKSSFPVAVAITPDDKTAYIADNNSGAVSVIDTQTNQVVGSPITVGINPDAIAITPDGKTAYVVNVVSKSVSVIDTQTNQVVGSITVKKDPAGIAITPDGKRAYVVNGGANDVSVIDTQTNQVVGAPIAVGGDPRTVGITPDGKTAYVASFGLGTVSVIDTQTNQVVGSPIGVGLVPSGIAVIPDQSPAASFSVNRVRPGVPTTLNASASSDPDGTIATYAWSFGDGQTATGGPQLPHTYRKPGTYTVTLTVDDGEGCPGFLFTGQTAFCNGSSSVSETKKVKVAYPGVRLKCAKSAGPRGCRFKLQALAKKGGKGKRPKPESSLAEAKLKPGRSAIVSLRPKKTFAAKLAGAEKVLVKETVTVKGSTRTTYRKLKIVQ